MEFGYWPVKGRAHGVRMLIAHVGMDIPEWNPKTKEEWGAKKAEFGKMEQCYFPNLPFFKDGNKVICETIAVAHSIALKANRGDLFGKNQADQVVHLNIYSALTDIFGSFLPLAGKTKAELNQAWPAFVESSTKPKLQGVVKALGNKPFMLSYPTFADIYFAYLYDIYEFVAQATGVHNPFDDFPQLSNLRKNVWALPGLKEFKTSPRNNIPMFFPHMVKFLQA